MDAKLAERLMLVLHDLDMKHPDVLGELIAGNELTEAEYVDAYEALCADCGQNEAPVTKAGA